jgi:hypothetical protein
MDFLSSDQVKGLLESYDETMIKNILLRENLNDNDQHIKIVKLNYMCARGLVNDVVVYLRELEVELGSELDFIINGIHPFFYFGNSLHTSLLFNSNKTGVELFNLLYEYGAVIERDYYGLLPWEQTSNDGLGMNWVHPLERIIIGKRSDQEFTNNYSIIQDQFALSLYSNPNIEQSG